MKNIMKYLSIILAVVLISSCEGGFMDINTNPNYPADADVTTQLPSGQIGVAAILGGDMELVGGLWSQQYTQNSTSNQYNTTVNYTLSNASYARFWSIPYSIALPDLRNTANLAVKAGYDNYFMAAEITTCFMYHILASWYESIPYTESLQGETNLYPAYDKGTDVNDALIKRIDAALAKQASAATVESITPMGKSDMIFGGDIEKWVEFGKSLKLKLMMRNWTKYSADIETLLNEGGFLTVDAGIFSFVDKENNSNPLYENDRRKLNTQNNIAACSTLMKYLKATKDPRIAVFYNTNSAGIYNSLDAGNRPSSFNCSVAKLAPTDGVYFMSVAEVNFLQAEAWARLGNTANAKAFYDEGVKLAFSRWSVDEVILDGSSFVATGGAYEFDATSTDTMLKCILTQKWIAATRCQAWDSYFDITRTGIPALGSVLTTDAGYVLGNLTPVVDSSIPAADFPKRMLYPKASSDNNPNAPDVIEITVKQWWQK